ncbi:MAG: signal peptidase II [Clostridia bacterium]|nr:signal peptidase II [Clostridia bacterium]
MKKNRLKFWLTVILVLIIDRITKELAGGIPAEGIALVPGVIGLRYAENAGAAFSMLSGHPRLLGVLSLALITGGYVWLRKKEIAAFPLFGLALMAGGAAGNMLDRLIRGFVPDMIETLFMNFPVFNIADSCLTVGCALVMISILFRGKDWEKKENG